MGVSSSNRPAESLGHDPILEHALLCHKLVCCFMLGSVGFCRCFYFCPRRRIALGVPDPFHLSIGLSVVRLLIVLRGNADE
ncbi:hypothetical protein KCU98_g172, partial [Aureobasidium melanogenum]